MKTVLISDEELDQRMTNCFRSVLAELGMLKPAPVNEIEKPLTIEGAADFLHLSVTTVYALVSKHKLTYLKQGKRLYFLKEDLLKYLKDGKRLNSSEIDSNVDSLIVKKSKRK